MDAALYRKTFHPRALIFREGAAGNTAFVIESGKVEISARRKGKEEIITKLGTGELFGEMALLDGHVRTGTARSLTDTTLIVIHREEVEKTVERADPILNLLFKGILERLRRSRTLSEQQDRETPSDKTIYLEDTVIDQVREQVISTLRFEQELIRALKENQFQLHYQPIVEAGSGALRGFEALIRWEHPEKGMIPPGHFIGLAEETGHIVAIGLWVLEEACNALKKFRVEIDGLSPFMSINLSARQMTEPTLVDDIRTIFENTGINPSEIKLEVTESLVMEDPEQAAIVLNQLKTLGVQLAIDDFGTGYSSLNYLNRFPFDVIKVDRSFISSMITDSGNRAIVKTVVALARELNKTVVAEGVEEEDELELIRKFGCDFVQGYFFSKPLNFDDALAFMAG